ncbi:hypothetical protein SKAU_G00205120 [Synaphobranchus kaupii]|uniref:Uncharacterized protein n=1 Tax=Synaphobranchus kaupii TaxID=118154 RepID=A0A9Q1FGR5_SYNKA|nr:hypothetical protein SKAU_G00205120 [Synaphobranchus kaupii]
MRAAKRRPVGRRDDAPPCTKADGRSHTIVTATDRPSLRRSHHSHSPASFSLRLSLLPALPPECAHA